MPKDTENERRNLRKEAAVSEKIYPVIDTDLARDNVENDLPAADLEDLIDLGEK